MTTRISALFVCGILTASAACAGTSSTWQDDDAKVVACFEAMDRDPAVQIVNAKFARRNPTKAQLADSHAATETEAAQLRLRVQKTRPCRELRLAAVHTHRPLLEPAYRILYYQADQVFEYLMNGWISHGLANQLSQKSLAAFQDRERQLDTAKSDGDRRALSIAWDEQLQRGHSNPPPDRLKTQCAWNELNIACE